MNKRRWTFVVLGLLVGSGFLLAPFWFGQYKFLRGTRVVEVMVHSDGHSPPSTTTVHHTSARIDPTCNQIEAELFPQGWKRRFYQHSWTSGSTTIWIRSEHPSEGTLILISTPATLTDRIKSWFQNLGKPKPPLTKGALVAGEAQH